MVDALLKPTEPSPRRVRMAADEREKMILDAAVRFFARHGFSAQIRDLARELGISQGLIYRYFRSKQALIERVYEHSFLQRWDPEWERTIRDRTRALGVRLRVFYTGYLAAIDDPDWIRLVMYSGLEGNDLTRRYIQDQVTELLDLIARECRTGVAGSGEEDGPASEAELERIWHLHSTFIYYLIRKRIFGTQVMQDPDLVVAVAVESFLRGLHARPPPRREPERPVSLSAPRGGPGGIPGPGSPRPLASELADGDAAFSDGESIFMEER